MYHSDLLRSLVTPDVRRDAHASASGERTALHSLRAAVVACIAALTVTASALATAGSAPVDLYKTPQAYGDDHPLADGVTYGASLFPLALTVRTTDGLWHGDQWVEKNEVNGRTGGTYAYVKLHHAYAHSPDGKISNWGFGFITIETGLASTPSVQTTMQHLRARLNDLNAGAVRMVRVAGYAGLSYDGRLKDGPNSSHRFVPFSSSDGSEASTDSYQIEATRGKGGAFRIDVIKVQGKTVVIYLDGFTGPPAKFPVFLGFANRILSTLRFTHK